MQYAIYDRDINEPVDDDNDLIGIFEADSPRKAIEIARQCCPLDIQPDMVEECGCTFKSHWVSDNVLTVSRVAVCEEIAEWLNDPNFFDGWQKPQYYSARPV